jgi:hypothetical protein
MVEPHAIFLYPQRSGSRILRGDPLCRSYDWVEAAQLRKYAEKLGRNGAVFFAVTAPRPALTEESDDAPIRPSRPVVVQEDTVTIVTIEKFPAARKFTTAAGLAKLRRFDDLGEHSSIKTPYSAFVDAQVTIEQSDNRVPHGRGFLRLSSGGSSGFYILTRDVVLEP